MMEQEKEWAYSWKYDQSNGGPFPKKYSPNALERVSRQHERPQEILPDIREKSDGQLQRKKDNENKRQLVYEEMIRVNEGVLPSKVFHKTHESSSGGSSKAESSHLMKK